MEFFKLMKRREASPNKKGNKVAYVRPGTDYIEALGSGSAGRKKIPTIWVTAKNGDKFEIPVDPKTGRVPQEYLFGRFLDINRGSRNGRERNILIDIGKEADMIHEIPDGGFTPQQIIETGWWQAVNESDIEGIDDTGARAFARELEDAAKSAWHDQYRAGLRFGRELEEYRKIMAKKEIGQESVDTNSTRIIVSCNMLDTIAKYRTLGDITVEMMEQLETELNKVTTQFNAKAHIRTLSNFVSYFADTDLYAEMKYRKSDHTAFEPKTDCDRRFMEKLREYIEYMKKWEYKPKTVKGRVSSVVRCYELLKEIKGEYELKDVESYDFRKLRNLMTNFKDSTVQNYLWNFGLFLDYATGNNPFELAKLRFSTSQVQRQFIFKNEWMKLYEVADVTEKLILSLGATMGLRKKEIIVLKVEDIQGMKLVIRGKGTGPNGKVEIKDITELVGRDLDAYLEHRNRILDRYGDRSRGHLFINEFRNRIGRPLSDRSLCAIIDRLVEKSGVSFSPHCLRRFYCTTMSDAGLDLDTIRRMMRHSSVETTLRCYLYADPRKIKTAIDSVNGAFSAISC